MNRIYEFKGKQYNLLLETKIKIDDEWVDGIIYMCLYYNPDGMVWVRTKEEFFEKFKLINNVC